MSSNQVQVSMRLLGYRFSDTAPSWSEILSTKEKSSISMYSDEIDNLKPSERQHSAESRLLCPTGWRCLVAASATGRAQAR